MQTDIIGFNMTIAECPKCGTHRHAFSEDDAINALKNHRCIKDMDETELHNIISQIIERKR